MSRLKVNSPLAVIKKDLKFPAVFARAQRILETTFGMELVELLSKAELEKGGEDAEAENAIGGRKKKGAPTPRV